MNEPDLVQLRTWQCCSNHAAVLDALAGLSADAEDSRLALIKGISLALSDEWDAARPYLARELDAEDTRSLSDAALARLLAGEGEQARELLEVAVDRADASAVEYGRLAVACLSQGDLEEARKHYLEAVHREPGRAEWHNNLAGILVRQQCLDEALEHYDRALRLKPELDQALNARQRVLMALERTAEVVEQLHRALKAVPDDAAARLRLARALNQDNRPVEAIQLLGAALRPPKAVPRPKTLERRFAAKGEPQKSWEDQISYRALLAELLFARSRYAQAIKVIDELLALQPERPFPHLQMKALALIEMGRYARAERLLDEAEADHPHLSALNKARATLYCESRRYAEAEGLLRGLLETYPGNAALKSQLAQTLLWTGKLDEAAALFEEAARLNPMALAGLVSAKQIPGDPRALEKMAAMANNPLLPDPARVTMGFALATVYDKQNEYDKAFDYLELANRLVDRQLHYQPEQFTQQVDLLIDVYTPELFTALPAIRHSARTPIFVVGMPRSGTTLIEQILSSHPAIFGAGELDYLRRLALLLPRVIKDSRPYPACLAAFTPHLREEGARFYLNGLDQYDREHPFVVDKMPHNFMHLGLIALILPKAKIIHIQRDPRDTGLSNYQQNFKARNGGMGYAFDLEKIARQLNDYRRMMDHWRAVLPLVMLELTYEELVSDQEGVTRRLLDFVGVDWDEGVRDFHKTERAVRTASVSQVRQPIYQTSRQKWRRYEPSLKPLLDTLDPETYAPWDDATESTGTVWPRP